MAGGPVLKKFGGKTPVPAPVLCFTADMCDLQVAGGGAGEGLAVPGLVTGEGAGVGGHLGLDVSAHCSDVETSPPHHLPRSASVTLDTSIQIFNEEVSFGFQVSTF